jgi:hypothetical protein
MMFYIIFFAVKSGCFRMHLRTIDSAENDLRIPKTLSLETISSKESVIDWVCFAEVMRSFWKVRAYFLTERRLLM